MVGRVHGTINGRPWTMSCGDGGATLRCSAGALLHLRKHRNGGSVATRLLNRMGVPVRLKVGFLPSLLLR